MKSVIILLVALAVHQIAARPQFDIFPGFGSGNAAGFGTGNAGPGGVSASGGGIATAQNGGFATSSGQGFGSARPFFGGFNAGGSGNGFAFGK